MSIAFSEISSTLRVPGTYGEFDASRALSAQPGELHRTLIIALKSAGGSAPAGSVVLVTGQYEGDALFGDRSQATEMVTAYKAVDRGSRLYVLPVAEDAGGAAAAGSLAFSGTATKAGTATSRIGDRRISTRVEVGMTAAQLATAHAADINAAQRVPLLAAVSTATVTLTARHKGTYGNELTIASELLPAGISVVTTQPTGGTTNPSLAAAIAAIDDSRYDTIITGLSDAANMTLLETEANRRWQPTIKLYTHVFAAFRGTFAASSTYGAARNNPHSTVIGADRSPTPPWIIAAQAAAWDAITCATMPNRPRTGLHLPNVEAPLAAEQFDFDERNALLYDGISTLRYDASGRVLIERLITTYQTSASGTADATYLSVGTLRNLAALWLAWMALGARHERDVIGPDGKITSPGVPMVTPKQLRGEIVALYRQRERAGLVAYSDEFAADLVVELNETDVERMDVHAAPRLVNGLTVTAFKISFQLGR